VPWRGQEAQNNVFLDGSENIMRRFFGIYAKKDGSYFLKKRSLIDPKRADGSKAERIAFFQPELGAMHKVSRIWKEQGDKNGISSLY
jgi:hypothetical protein